MSGTFMEPEIVAEEITVGDYVSFGRPELI